MQAQYDNLGDMVIRSEIARWVSQGGTPLVVTGNAPAGYLEGLELPSGSITVRSIREALSTGRGEVVDLIFAPGEQALDHGPGEWVKATANLALASLIRARRGIVLKVGKGYKGRGRVLTALERALIRVSTRTFVRDRAAASLFPSARLMPDIALSSPLLDGDNSDEPRTKIAFSLRSDRRHPKTVLTEVSRAAMPLSPMIVVQVERDQEFAESLASGQAIDVVAWHGTMREQLLRVKAAYFESEFIVSDRLHSLLFGLRCGAIPIGVETGNNEKLRRQLGVIGLDHLVVDGWDVSAIAAIMSTDRARLRSEADAAVETAQRQLREVQSQVTDLLNRR